MEIKKAYVLHITELELEVLKEALDTRENTLHHHLMSAKSLNDFAGATKASTKLSEVKKMIAEISYLKAE